MSDYKDYGNNPYGEPPSEDYSVPNNLEPIYQQLLGHLSSAHKLAATNFRSSSLGRHLLPVEKAIKLVKEAGVHSASFLPTRAAATLNNAIDTLSTVSMSAGRDTRPDDFESNPDPKDPSVKFHKHISDFVIKAHKQAGGSLPGEKGWDS